MPQSVYVYDPTAHDPLSQVRGIGRYLQILKENFSSNMIFTDNLRRISADSILINPFFNFLKQPLLMTRLAKKQIAVIHDLIPLKYPDHFPAGIKGRLNIFLNKLALKNYDLIITDSQTSKKDIVQILNQPEEKTKVIYPCLPKIFFRSKVEDLKSKVYNNTIYEILNTKYCLYVGDATWNKNLVNLAKALKIINLPCIFVGKVFSNVVGGERRGAPTSRADKLASEAGAGARQDPPLYDPWKREFNQFLELAKNDKRFIFAGYIPDDQLIELYKHAKLNILVSRDEGFGFSYFEAAFQSCPSVLSNIPVLKETASDTALFCDPENPNDIADKIGELYFNEDLRKKLGEKAKQRLKNFSSTNFKKSFLNLY